MEQHAVPQHIASYEFRLVGDMTFKQFAYLASGVIVALLFYAMPIHPLLKWPLIFFFGLFGAALAFVPIQERPLSQWLLAFTKAVFSPTQYLWQKQQIELEMFKSQPLKVVLTKAPAPQADKTQMNEYLQTLPASPTKSPLDEKEEKFFRQTAELFQTVQPIRPVFTPKPFIPPTPANQPIPTAQPVTPSLNYQKTSFVPQASQPKKPAVEAKISPTLPIPAPPTRPNILVGMVLNQGGEIIEGAILEIRNSKGMPMRALKTNKLGQFQIATPLENDLYEIETEKEGYTFDIIKISIKGEVIPPIEIRAK